MLTNLGKRVELSRLCLWSKINNNTLTVSERTRSEIGLRPELVESNNQILIDKMCME